MQGSIAEVPLHQHLTTFRGDKRTSTPRGSLDLSVLQLCEVLLLVSRECSSRRSDWKVEEADRKSAGQGTEFEIWEDEED